MAKFNRTLAWWHMTRKQKALLREERLRGNYLPAGVTKDMAPYFMQADQGSAFSPTADGFSGHHYIAEVQSRSDDRWETAMQGWTIS